MDSIDLNDDVTLKGLEFFEDCKKKAMRKLFSEVYYNGMKEDMEADPEQYIYDYLRGSKWEDYITRSAKKKPEIQWLTINPKDNMAPASVIHKLFKSKMFVWVVYVFEQRSESGLPSGFHCHALFKRKNVLGHIKKEIQRRMEPYIGSPKSLYYRGMYTPEDSKKCINYMLHPKLDPHKAAKQPLDQKWRELEGYQSHYVIGECPLLVGTQNSDSQDLNESKKIKNNFKIRIKAPAKITQNALPEEVREEKEDVSSQKGIQKEESDGSFSSDYYEDLA